jgi:hypothetical protein
LVVNGLGFNSDGVSGILFLKWIDYQAKGDEMHSSPKRGHSSNSREFM